MYIQITERCNMECAHCCFSCTSKGRDMSLSIYEKSLALVEEYGSIVELGGGEPTIHPDFWKFLGLGVSISDEAPLWLSTNGSITKTSIALAKMAKNEVISCQLSLTEFHSEISTDVTDAFGKLGKRFSYALKSPKHIAPGIVKTHLVNTGRATSLKKYVLKNECPCPAIMIKPSGIVYQCGCINSPVIGNVWDGIKYTETECYKDKAETSRQKHLEMLG